MYDDIAGRIGDMDINAHSFGAILPLALYLLLGFVDTGYQRLIWDFFDKTLGLQKKEKNHIERC